MKVKCDRGTFCRFFAVMFSLALIFSLTACADMGKFSEENDFKDYYESIGSIEGIYDGGSRNYDLKDSLFNDYTVNNLNWPDEDDKVAYEEYVYIVIPFNADLTVESLALYLYSETNTNFQINFFYYENSTFAPKKIKYKSSPETETIVVTEDGIDVEKEVEIEYDDPAYEDRVASTTCYATSEWGDFAVEYFNQPGYTDGYLHAKNGGLLYVRIENNSGLNKNMQSCPFNFINLIIRAE